MIEPTGDIEDAIRELLSSDSEAARAYLKESFLLQAMSALFHARRAAGLTQTQLAERLHTRQSSIARLERDQSGSITLRRFVEVALACGVMPLDIAMVPLQELTRFATESAEAPRTQITFNAWRAGQAGPSLSIAPQIITNAPTQTSVVQQSGIILPQGSLAQAGLWLDVPVIRAGGQAA